MKRTLLWLAAAAVLAAPLAVPAQIVPPAPGVELPQSYFDQIGRDPKAFQFQKAWIEKAKRAKDAREEFFSQRHPEGMSFASLPAQIRESMMVSGTTYVPVLMGKYSNTGADPYPVASLQTKLFAAPPAASMTSLYDEMSYGSLNLTGTVYGWYQVSNIDTYYEGAASCSGLQESCGAHTGEFIMEVLQLADPAVNFGTYDNDGPDGIPNSGDDDGFVDFVAIVQPEIGAECGGIYDNNLWSHRWVVGGWTPFGQSPFVTNDARTGGGLIQIWDYTIQPALGSANGCGSGVIEIGVFCHEFGHAFGLPDLYDTNGGSAGIGHWGLMGSGNWNVPTNPSHMDAWCKSELGWIVPTEVGPVSQAYSIDNSEVNPEAYRLNVMEEKFARRDVNPITGSWSMRCMLTAAEATARSWPGGAGYGNGWDEVVVREFSYNGTNPVNLQYDYAYNSEPDYDFTYVKIDVNGTVSYLTAYDGGPASGHANIDLTPYLNGSGASSYKLVFQFTSDRAWSDEDGDFNSSATNGAFKFDNVTVTGGGEAYSTGFETYEDGWHYDRTMNPATEYFLVENRNATGAQFDQSLHGQGLMICHVEQDVATTTLGNSGDASNNVTRGMMLEEADNLNHLRNNTNRGDGGDIFPGTSNNTTFNSVSAPNSNSHNAVATNAEATLIGAPGATMTANLRGGYFAPTAASIAPNTGNNDAVVTITDLLGTRFIHGATFFLRDAGMNEYGEDSSGWVGHAKLAGTLDLYAVPGGVYDVVVRNPDGQEAVIAAGFTVNDVLTGVEIPGALVNALYQNHPNPFNPTTTIRYSIEKQGHVTLAVYNVAGQLVRTLVDEVQSPVARGYSVLWNATNDSGEPVASGVYLYKLAAPGGYEAVRKLVVLK
jgi:M6 family metalloprotease-like protein